MKTRPPTDPEAPIEGCPDIGELVDFYASLGEPCDAPSIEKWLKEIRLDKVATLEPSPEQPPEKAQPEREAHSESTSLEHIALSIRCKDGTSKENGKIIGLLRACRDNRFGVINEIAIHENHRGKGHGRRLRDTLLADEPVKNGWRGSAARIAGNLDRDLSIIRVVYAIFLVEGFKQVIQATYRRWVKGPNALEDGVLAACQSLSPHQPLPPLAPTWLLVFTAISIGALGVRFFWAIGNIRRFVLHRIINLDPPNRRAIVMLHFSFLFLHATAFFLMCEVFQDLGQHTLGREAIDRLILTLILLLAMNAIWLLFLIKGRTDHGPERAWLLNNSFFTVVFAIILFKIGSLAKTPEAMLTIVAACSMANSLLDFLVASDGYVLRDAFGGG